MSDPATPADVTPINSPFATPVADQTVPVDPAAPVEAPPAETPPADAKTDDPPAQTDPVSPPFNAEEYIAGVKPDEGKDYTFDADLLKEVAPVANELGIKPEALGKLANLLAARESAQAAKAKEAADAWTAAREANVKAMDEAVAKLKADNPQMEARVNAALELPFLKNSTFRKALEETELSHDPVVWQLLERVGRTLGNDPGAGVQTSPGGGRTMTFTEVLTGGQYK